MAIRIVLSREPRGCFWRSYLNKKYYFVDVVLSRVDRADVVSQAVRQWIMNAYRGMVIPVEIPKTSIAATASAEFGTVYDMDQSSTQPRHCQRL